MPSPSATRRLIQDYLFGGAVTNTAVLNGVGTNAAPAQTATADLNFFDYRVESTAASGTSRGMYLRQYLSGGAGGEALRVFNTAEDDTPADTVNGAHISQNFGATAGNVTGLGTALRATFHVPNRSLGGTTAAIQAELWADGASSALGGTTSLLRLALGGNATGVADFDDNAFLMHLAGATAGAGHLFETGLTAATINAATTASLKINIGGTTYYIPIATANS